MYCSSEPCILCSGAIKWAGVSRVVFSVSQAMLQRLSGGRPNPPCAELVNTGGRRIVVDGPLIPDEGLAVFAGYDFTPKREYKDKVGGVNLKLSKGSPMECHFAADPDLDLLAEWNHQLIQDEGHRNPMTGAELRERMRGWLMGEYRAVVFTLEGEPVAYALYRETADEIYLRQFFVRRDRRREGLGRGAMGILREQVWARDKRLTVEVLTANQAGIAFWRSAGYRDYSLMLEILPEG